MIYKIEIVTMIIKDESKEFNCQYFSSWHSHIIQQNPPLWYSFMDLLALQGVATRSMGALKQIKQKAVMQKSLKRFKTAEWDSFCIRPPCSFFSDNKDIKRLPWSVLDRKYNFLSYCFLHFHVTSCSLFEIPETKVDLRM